MSDEPLRRAAEALDRATALIVAAGAGMGVDSGLPDFRGTEGFWRAYPPLRELGLRFEEIANPRWFSRDPELAWGFYGHRLSLYRRTRPHDGFSVLQRWSERATRGSFVFTSNVDGHFARTGFDEARIHECHGSLNYLQCTKCPHPIWSADGIEIDVDETTFRARGDLPRCPGCQAIARPNVLMFGDGGWDATRSEEQEARLREFLLEVTSGDIERTCVIECGAGTAIPSVRHFTESLARAEATLVRINIRESAVAQGDSRGVALALPARDALLTIDRLRAS